MTALCFIVGVGAVVYAIFSDLAKIARWFPIKFFLEGLFGGLGLRLSGVFRQPHPPRRRSPRRPSALPGDGVAAGQGTAAGPSSRIIRSARAALDDDARLPPRPRRWSGSRADNYFPWEVSGDEFPENLPPAHDPPRITHR
jgi:hypothetical protein